MNTIVVIIVIIIVLLILFYLLTRFFLRMPTYSTLLVCNDTSKECLGTIYENDKVTDQLYFKCDANNNCSMEDLVTGKKSSFSCSRW